MIDLVVVGGGQAGLAAGAAAAEHGLRVVVLEKTDRYRRLGALLGRDPVDRARRRDDAAAAPRRRPGARAACWSRASSRPSPRRATRACRSPSAGPSTSASASPTAPTSTRCTRTGRREDRRAAAEHAGHASLLVDGDRSRRRRGRRGDRGARRAARDRRLPGRQGARQALPRLGRRPDARALEPAAASATGSGSRASAGAAASSRPRHASTATPSPSPLSAFEPESYLPLAQYHSQVVHPRQPAAAAATTTSRSATRSPTS